MTSPPLQIMNAATHYYFFSALSAHSVVKLYLDESLLWVNSAIDEINALAKNAIQQLLIQHLFFIFPVMAAPSLLYPLQPLHSPPASHPILLPHSGQRLSIEALPPSSSLFEPFVEQARYLFSSVSIYEEKKSRILILQRYM